METLRMNSSYWNLRMLLVVLLFGSFVLFLGGGAPSSSQITHTFLFLVRNTWPQFDLFLDSFLKIIQSVFCLKDFIFLLLL